MKVLIFCAMLSAAYAANPNCATVICDPKPPLTCPGDSVLIEGCPLPGECCPRPDRCQCKSGCVTPTCSTGYRRVLVSTGTGTPGTCCNIYKCELDCSTFTCEIRPPLTCPEDSMLIPGVIPPGQCCPTADHCECQSGCVTPTCQDNYHSVLVSKGTGTPGSCCDKYICELAFFSPDCSTFTCEIRPPLTCPEDSVLIPGVIPSGECCPTADRCECQPGCVTPKCQDHYRSVLVSTGTGTPGNCCNKYICELDCTTFTCENRPPLTCPEDSVLIPGVIPSGECCPTADRCECQPGCVTPTCQDHYRSVLVSMGTGTPGNCCNKYICELDCTTFTCENRPPLTCPEDSVLIPGVIPSGECCPTADRCECQSGCVTPTCQDHYRSVLVSMGTGTPGNCCNKYICELDCTTFTCENRPPLTCPEDSVLIPGVIPSGECCPTADRCECQPGCVTPTCQDHYRSVLVSTGTGTPGTCCNKYICELDCSTFTCENRPPLTCPEDSVLIPGVIPSGECCPTADRCECQSGCVTPTCQDHYRSVLVSMGTGTPGNCCNKYICELDCSTFTCEIRLPLTCPEDSVLIPGIIPSGECCPTADRCECQPGCVTPTCQDHYRSVLVSMGTGTPGTCCNKYICELDCTTFTCENRPPLTCPEDSVLIQGVIPSGECCPTADRCECQPGCVTPTCQDHYRSVLVSVGTGTPGTCCNKYICELDCTTFTCEIRPPLTCPEDSVLIPGVIPSGECCPTADRCECQPGCVTPTCQDHYRSVLVSMGTGTPGTCCDKYICELDCTTFTCENRPPLTCPEDSVLIPGVIPSGECCPTADRCECQPGCVTPPCQDHYRSVLVSTGTGTPGTCCNKYICELDCSTFTCEIWPPLTCPEDSVLIPGVIPSGECCPTPDRCDCQSGCVTPTCQDHYRSVLVSMGTGTPGTCCNKYICELDCSTFTCEIRPPLTCPEDSVVIPGVIPSGECCPTADRCECQSGCMTPTCQDHYRSVLVSMGTGTPGTCCNKYICELDCSTFTCEIRPPLTCPEDSVLIPGVIPSGECCPTADRCECQSGCVTPTCQDHYRSVLVSMGTGTPGNCCNKYICELDCSTFTCEIHPPLTCPEDSVLIPGVIPLGQCCPTADRCECKSGCVTPTCQDHYRSVLVSMGTGTPGSCCNKYTCELDCSTVTCVNQPPPNCPEDSVLIPGVIPPGQCCRTPDVCKCKPGCAPKICRTECQRVLVSKGTGTPGKCCDVYECESACYTQWFDLDDPSGMGDYETLEELRKQYPGKICPKPFTIQATTLSGVPAENTGQVIQLYDKLSGFACVNSQQKNGTHCLDYEVRFRCPCPWPIKNSGSYSEDKAKYSSQVKG